MVARRVEAADLGRDVGLEGAIAENEREERQQEQRFKCHHEMADRHQPGAKDHGAALTAEGDPQASLQRGGSDKQTRYRNHKSAMRRRTRIAKGSGRRGGRASISAPWRHLVWCV